jgi:hypothetical protein
MHLPKQQTTSRRLRNQVPRDINSRNTNESPKTNIFSQKDNNIKCMQLDPSSHNRTSTKTSRTQTSVTNHNPKSRHSRGRKSFRRQVYVAPQPEEAENLPTTIVISYEDTTYRVFTTYDEMVCFLCKKTEHIEAKCPNPTENAMQQEDLPDTSDTEVIPQEKAQTENLEKDNQGKPPNKRKAKNTESTISKLTDPNSIETNTEEITFKEPNNQPKTYTAQEKTPKSKRVKRSQSAENLHRQPSSTESLTSVPDNTKESAYQQIKRIIMEDPTTLPLTHENFISFIELTYGNSNPEAELQRFTDDTEGVIQMIMTIPAAINNQSMKNRLTRLRKKLENKSERKTTQQNVRQDSDTDDTY